MADMMQGLVVRATAGFIDVRIDGDVVQARMRGRLKNAPRTTDLCVIGDQVMVSQPDEQSFVVVEVLPRGNRFSRLQPGRGPQKEDVLVANLDQLMITFCHGRPVLNTRLLDRFLVIAEHEDIDPVIVMNKADLREPNDLSWRQAYESIGYPILTVSAGTGEGMDALTGAERPSRQRSSHDARSLPVLPPPRGIPRGHAGDQRARDLGAADRASRPMLSRAQDLPCAVHLSELQPHARAAMRRDRRGKRRQRRPRTV